MLPLHSAIDLAERVAILDQLSNGRIELGIGSGAFSHEFEARGLALERKWNLFFDNCEILMSVFKTGVVTRQSGDREVKFPILPSVLQVPYPPIWMAANIETAEWCGNSGFGLLLNYYNKPKIEFVCAINKYISAATNVIAGDKIKIATIQHMCVSEDDSVTLQAPRRALKKYIADVRGAFKGQGTNAPQMSSRDDVEKHDPCPYDRTCFGSAETVIRRVEELRKFGVTDILFMPQFADLPWGTSHKSLNAFIDDVFPYITNI